MSVHLRPLRWGILLSVLSIAYGFALGGWFGAAEDSLKDRLKSSAEAVRGTVYRAQVGPEASEDQVTEAMGKVLDKSWTYLKRAHLHANGIGTSALALCLLLAMCTRSHPGFRAAAGFLLGLGALGYSVFWMAAGLMAPGLGGTGAAKDALEWLAVGTAGSAILGLVATGVVLVPALFSPARDEGS